MWPKAISTHSRGNSGQLKDMSVFKLHEIEALIERFRETISASTVEFDRTFFLLNG